MSGPMLFNAGAIAAGGQTVPLTTQLVLDMPYGQLSQLRAKVLDDISVQVFQPQAIGRLQTQNAIANFNAFSQLLDPFGANTEFYIFENQRIFLQVANISGRNLVQTRIAFYGIKYILDGDEGPSSGSHLKPIATYKTIDDALASNNKFTVIPQGGWGR
jgi:hypothetical protein